MKPSVTDSVGEPRAADYGSAAAAVSLAGSMFLAWFGHSEVHGAGPFFVTLRGNLYLSLSGWKVAPGVGAVALVIAMIAAGHLIAIRRGFRSPIPAVGALMLTGGTIALVLVLHRMESPPDVYGVALPPVYLAVLASGACIVAGVAQLATGETRVALNLGRLKAGDLPAAVGGILLIAGMLFGWYEIGHRPPLPYLINGNRILIPPDTLSPWVSHDWVVYPLTAIAVGAIALWGLPALQPFGSLQRLRLGLSLAGALSVALVAFRISNPVVQSRYGFLYDATAAGAYVSLAGALLVASSPLFAARIEGDELTGVPGPISQPTAPGRVPMPILGAGTLVVALAVISAPLTPILSLFEIAGAAAAYRIGRWWLLAVPIVIAVFAVIASYQPCDPSAGDCDTAGLAVIAWSLIGAGVTLAVAAGVGARRLVERRRAGGTTAPA